VPDLEDLLGGRVLAWVGGLAVTLGVCFLLAIAVSRGWIGEVERTVLAGALSLALLAAGAWWQERRSQRDAARAAAAAGIAGLFATCVVAGNVYELVPVLATLTAAVAVGAAATLLAIRWATPGLAALGILGALVSPALLGALDSSGGVAILLVATASAVGVLLWRRWSWLGYAAFAIATPQWIFHIAIEQPSQPVVIGILGAFGLLAAAAAVGFEVRSGARDLRVASSLLLALNALVLAAIGASLLGDGWLVALAAAHPAAGLAARRSERVSPEMSLVALALAVVLADVALVALVDGLPLVLAWVAGGIGFAALARRAVGLDRQAAFAGLSGHLLLALAHALIIEARPETIAGGPEGAASLIALAAVAAACGLSGRLAGGDPPRTLVLDVAGLAVLAYQTAIALDGLPLTLALAAEAVTLALLARRVRAADERAGELAAGNDVVARGGAAAFAALALGHALAVLAPPTALIDGLTHPAAAAAGLGAVALAAALLGALDPRRRAHAYGAAATVALYALSTLLVTPFQPAPDQPQNIEEQGQALMSGLWAVVGVAALITGLVRDQHALRAGALALLAITVGKVFVFDLASLSELSRVASFVALGLLLLGAAFAWQRFRPRPAPDFRTVPPSLR
jgi:hypothetical protein